MALYVNIEKDCISKELGHIIPKMVSLQKISQNKVKGIICSFHRNFGKRLSVGCEEVKKMREYFLQLPLSCRDSLLQELRVRSIGGEDKQLYPMRLLALELLFTTGIAQIRTSLDVQLQEDHFRHMLQLLYQEGKSIQSLQIFSKYTNSLTNLFRLGHVLRVAENLVYLSLGETCTDEVMRLIGLNCTKLQILSAAGSRVTDNGLHLLTQNIVSVAVPVDNQNNDWESTMWRHTDIFLPMEDLVPYGERVDCYQRKKSPVCDSLKRLELGSGKITVTGLLVMLEMVSGLQSFGELDLKEFLVKLLDDFEKIVESGGDVEVPRLNLTSIYVSVLDDRTLPLIQNMFPRLQSLKCHRYLFRGQYSYIPLHRLSCFTSLQSLDVRNSDIYSLSPGIKSTLKHLRTYHPGVLNLSRLFTEYPSLQTLHTTFETSISDRYLTKDSKKPVLEDLHSITLHGTVTADTLIKVLKHTPNIEEVRLKEMPSGALYRLCEVNMPKIKTFKVCYGYFADTKQELLHVLSAFPSLSLVGNLRFLKEAN